MEDSDLWRGCAAHVEGQVCSSVKGLLIRHGHSIAKDRRDGCITLDHPEVDGHRLQWMLDWMLDWCPDYLTLEERSLYVDGGLSGPQSCKEVI